MEEWQTLEDHLNNVARLASEFASPFSSDAHARLLGLLHDIGKVRDSFQNYLLRENGLPSDDRSTADHVHSGAGMCWLARKMGPAGGLLAYCSGGHHSGLPDNVGGENPCGALQYRIKEESSVLAEPAVASWIAEHESDWHSIPLKRPWPRFSSSDASFWIRMLFSCLVDADYLDTESFVNPRRSSFRGLHESISVLSERFSRMMDAKRKSAKKTVVNEIRDRILEDCERAATGAKGIYSLSVPTGAGKTLSSTAFAFRHAVAHGMKRIVYVIPYTSIIEQTAAQLELFLGAENVVQHHSNLDPDEETLKGRLAAENWDAPIIVTTDVQFFESLHAHRPGRCRKLHNICESVVILDEVQLLPVNLMIPIAETVRQLTANYGCTFVMSTATMPDIGEVGGFRTSLADMGITEISRLSPEDRANLKRAEIYLPPAAPVRSSWSDVADELAKHDQVLCIVNTRREARELYARMPKGTIHLSAAMCAAHRSKVIEEVKSRLLSGSPVRVVSTQLVEAGVDIDFPVVFRAMTGLSSIVQSAGRCNREGRLGRLGKVVVFNPPRPSPPGPLRWAEDAMREVLAEHGPSVDMDDGNVHREYFRRHSAKFHDFGEGISKLLGYARTGIQFREASAMFRMIDSADSASVVVGWGEGQDAIDDLIANGPDWMTLRRMQRFSVSVPTALSRRLLNVGAVEDVAGVLVQKNAGLYTDEFGLDIFFDESSFQTLARPSTP